jgi:hypothetical protein
MTTNLVPPGSTQGRDKKPLSPLENSPQKNDGVRIRQNALNLKDSQDFFPRDDSSRQVLFASLGGTMKNLEK